MSSVSASASEYSQLFGFDEETGEVHSDFSCDEHVKTPSPSSEPNKMDSTHRSGNKIGHDPNHLKLDTNFPIQKGKGGMPAILFDLCERADKWAENPNLYPEFTRALSVNGCHIRSEGREAIAVTLKAMLRKTDLSTLGMGKPSRTGLRNWSFAALLKDAPIGRKRLERVFQRFYRASVVKSHRQCKKNADGTYEHYASIRIVSEVLFELLGVSKERIKKQRQKASDRIKQKAAELRLKAIDLVKTGKRKFDEEMQSKDSSTIDATVWNTCWRKAVDIVKGRVPHFHPERHKAAIKQQCIALYEAAI